jgi:hypothetical protein
MNAKTTIAIIAAVAILAAAITPTLMTSASAQGIRDGCVKNNRISEGDCEGNTEKNGKTDARLNPANKLPPGQQPEP